MPAPTKRAPRAPLVLLVGEGEATSDALAASLKLRGLGVMSSPAERAAAAAVARAPDLVMLLGDAAQEGGQRVIKTLASRATTARLPVAVLEDGDAASLDRRLRALRSGAIAVIERQASVDAMAGRIGELAWRVADHTTRAAAGVEVTLDELTAVIRKELGLLVPEDDGQSVAAPGREMAEAIQVFVERIRALVQRGDMEGARAALAARPAQMRFDPAMLAELDDGATLALRDARVLLVHDDPSRADALAQELRARGSIVVVSGRSERGLARGRELDPEVVLLDSGCVAGTGLDVGALLARDARLRWAAVLVVSWDEVWPAGVGVPRMGAIAARVAPHRTPERELADRVTEEAHFDVDVGRIGPSRILRALAQAPHVLGVTALDELSQAHVDLANGLIAGATADGLEGLPALAVLVEMSAGVLRIERRRAPSAANVLLPVEDALAMAGRENAPERLSSPPPSATAAGSVPAVAGPTPVPVAELDAPFDGDSAPEPSPGVPPPKPLADVPSPPPRAKLPTPAQFLELGAPRPSITTLPDDDAATDGLAALLEPESMAPTPRMRPRPRTNTPPYPEPTLDAQPTKRAPHTATLLGVAPATKSAETGIGTGAETEAEPQAETRAEVEPVEAAAREAVSAPRADATLVDQPLPLATALPKPTMPAAPTSRRSKLPVALALGALVLAVGGVVTWRFVLPALRPRRPVTFVIQATPTPTLPQVPTPVVPAPQPTPSAPEPVVAAPPPDAIPPTLVQPTNLAPTVAAVRTTPDAGPADAPALAGAEAQALASALEGVLADAGPDPDLECDRLTDEAESVTDTGRAAALLLQAAALSERNPHPVEALARLYLRTGNAAGAVEWATKLVALRRRRASIRVLLGDARRATGDVAGARRAYQDALELDPADGDATARLAQ